MMTSEGTVKLIDFGIATRSGTRDSCLTGKPSYMAPEMVIELRADHKSDLFSLGTVLYEMLTGERLFRGNTTSEILEQVVAGTIPAARARRPDLPDGVVAILERALERDPAKRFPSAGAMGEACEHFLYDKGYGPTNLTLKTHLAFLFPRREEEPAMPAEERFPVVESTLIPIADGPTPGPRDGGTRVSPLSRTFTRVVTQRPEDAPTAAIAPPGGVTRPATRVRAGGVTRPPEARPAVTRTIAPPPPTRTISPRPRVSKAARRPPGAKRGRRP